QSPPWITEPGTPRLREAFADLSRLIFAHRDVFRKLLQFGSLASAPVARQRFSGLRQFSRQSEHQDVSVVSGQEYSITELHSVAFRSFSRILITASFNTSFDGASLRSPALPSKAVRVPG